MAWANGCSEPASNMAASPEDRVVIPLVRCQNIRNLGANSNRSGFIQYHRGDFRGRLQGFTVSNEHPSAAFPTPANHDGHGGGEAQCTGHTIIRTVVAETSANATTGFPAPVQNQTKALSTAK